MNGYASPHVQSTGPADPRATKDLEAAKERIGDGKQIKPEHMPHLSYVELIALHHANPQRYRALVESRDPEAAWTPTPNAGADSMTGANL
jgi:hypothetical protein